MEPLMDEHTNGISDSLLAKYAAAETSADENKLVHDWMNESADNNTYAEGLLMIIAHSNIPATNPDVEAAWEAFSNKIILPSNKKAPVRLLYKWMSAAAVVLVFVAVGWLIHEHNKINTIEAFRMPRFREIAGNGERTDKLADGSTIKLSKNSVLTAPLVFNSADRTVTLKGSGYFSIIHNAHRPFRIMVNDILVTDIGTSFTIESDSLQTSVEVESGIVEVSRLHKTVQLYQGDKLQVQVTDTILPKPIVKKAVTVTQQPVKPIPKKISNTRLSQEDIAKTKSTMRSIIQDIENGGLLNKNESLDWFGLTTDVFILNGRKQTEQLHQQFIKKYQVRPDFGFFYGPVQITGKGVFITKEELNN